VDASGNLWVAYVQEDTSTGNAGIVLYRKSADKGTWASAQQFFGDVNASAPFGADKRSARLVTLPGGIGMLFSVGPDIYWQERPLKGGADLAWNSPTLLAGRRTRTRCPATSARWWMARAMCLPPSPTPATSTSTGATPRPPVVRRAADGAEHRQNPAAKPVYAQLAWLGGTRWPGHQPGDQHRCLPGPDLRRRRLKCAELAKHDGFDTTVYSFDHPA
jgi:hypothetical protein